MKTNFLNQPQGTSKPPAVLVAVDFSPCSRLALEHAKGWCARHRGEAVVLHVIDQGFVRACIDQQLGSKAEIKKNLFTRSKSKLQRYLERAGMDNQHTRMIVCEGTPCMEINRKAVENDVRMIIMGAKGNSNDMKAIFFGSTTERVLRFIKRPVLCIPPEETNPESGGQA